MGRLDELMGLVDATEAFPPRARQAIRELLDQCDGLAESIMTFEAEIIAHARKDETARRLTTIPGIGPITASLIAATVGDIGSIRKCGVLRLSGLKNVQWPSCWWSLHPSTPHFLMLPSMLRAGEPTP